MRIATDKLLSTERDTYMVFLDLKRSKTMRQSEPITTYHIYGTHSKNNIREEWERFGLDIGTCGQCTFRHQCVAMTQYSGECGNYNGQ
jgi:hypothetical protein